MKLTIKYLGVFLVILAFIGCEESKEGNTYYPPKTRDDQTKFDDINSTYPIQNTLNIGREKIIPLECNSSLADIKIIDVNSLQGYKIYAYQKRVVAYKIHIEDRAEVTYNGLPKNILTNNNIMDIEHDIITDYRKVWIAFNCDGSFKFSDITELTGNSVSERLSGNKVYYNGITKEVEVFHDFGLSLFFKGNYSYEEVSYPHLSDTPYTRIREQKGYITLKNDKDIQVCDSLLYFPTIPLTVGKIEKVATCY